MGAPVVVDVEEGGKIKMKTKKCPFCDKGLYSDIGKKCKMCGMSLNLKENFCSINCERTYTNVKKIKFI